MNLVNYSGGDVVNVFISQPMGGRTLDSIRNTGLYIADWVNEHYKGIDGNFCILDNISVNLEYINGTMKHEPMDYLAESLKLLGKANIVVFASNWKSSTGCRIEHMCAEEFGKEMLYADTEPETDVSSSGS